MIGSVFARAPAEGARDEPTAAWTSALATLRGDIARDGPPPVWRLHEYLAHVPPAHVAAATEDLISVHLTATWAAGGEALLETYAKVPSAMTSGAGQPARFSRMLYEDEFLARCRPPHGDCPTLEDYAARCEGRADVLSLLEARHAGAGRYVKLEPVARSAAGEVWLALDRRTRNRIVLKHPASTLTPEPHPGLVEPTGHAGLVGALDWGADGDGRPFISMRHVDGQRLDQLARSVGSTGRSRRRAVRRLVAAVASAGEVVARAHERGLIHGDLKTAHVIVDDESRAAVVDWNLTGRPAVDAGVLGTPEYMAPEQVEGACDERSDVFGLGAMLFEVLHGRPPRDWGPVLPADWRRRVREEPVGAPRRTALPLSRRVRAVCARALAHDPELRQRSAADFTEELRAATGSRRLL